MLRRLSRFSGIFICVITVMSGQQAPAPDLQREVTDLRALVLKLQARIEELETKVNGPAVAAVAPAPAALPSPSPDPDPAPEVPGPPATETPVPQAANAVVPQNPPGTGFPWGTSFNALFDGYYSYNFNAPIGRVNRLRAYDVSSNSFSINQAAVVVENAADPEHKKYWGMRLDLQYGQATETLQGNPENEPRPDIYRNIFQAYGTVVIPLGHHYVTVDFGKFASSLGIEGNYTKDQMNYSRSFWFSYLPFYHMGVRVNYKVNDHLALNYWVVNGTQQTEAYNGFKDQFAGLTIQPVKSVIWNVYYYLGQEHPDVIFYPYGAPPGLTNLPTQQGVPFQYIPNAPTGRMHIFDSYATWNATHSLTFAGEGDWVISRLHPYSAPQHTAGGAAYARYQISKAFAVAVRAEYLDDRGGLFSGIAQALKEATFTTEYKFPDNFLMRLEWRRDFSNQPYFYSDTTGLLKGNQTTATVGVIWWFGTKQGAW